MAKNTSLLHGGENNTVVVKLHIFTKATVQFCFSFSYKVFRSTSQLYFLWNFINKQFLNELQKAPYSLQNFS